MANPPKSILGGSPIRVAVPWRLLETAMANIILVGLIFSLRARARAMGATIRTVATFSTKAEINPVRAQIYKIAQQVFLARSTISSARYAGTRLSIKTSATASVPTNIPITFQLIARNASFGLRVWLKTSRIAPIKATRLLFWEGLQIKCRKG